MRFKPGLESHPPFSIPSLVNWLRRLHCDEDDTRFLKELKKLVLGENSFLAISCLVLTPRNAVDKEEFLNEMKRSRPGSDFFLINRYSLVFVEGDLFFEIVAPASAILVIIFVRDLLYLMKLRTLMFSQLKACSGR